LNVLGMDYLDKMDGILTIDYKNLSATILLCIEQVHLHGHVANRR
jgi:hypothetical protein